MGMDEVVFHLADVKTRTTTDILARFIVRPIDLEHKAF